MPIDPDQIQSDLTALAAFTETPGEGTTRPTFSAAWRQARDYVVARAEAAGFKHRIDAAGNVRARSTALTWESAAWVSGSYLDTPVRGGNYAGALGVAVALEVVRAARESLKTALPMELVVWAEGEGARFGQRNVGSRAACGDLTPEHLAALTDSAGTSYLDAGAAHGVDPAKLPSDRLTAAHCVGALEVHVEEGARLWNAGMSVGLVTAVAGRRLYACTVTGAAADAGSTAMKARSDALAGAAAIIVALEAHAAAAGADVVLTVGRIACSPNADDVIPGEVTFSIDFRSASAAVMAREDQAIRAAVARIAEERGLKADLRVTATSAPTDLDERVRQKCDRAAAERELQGVAVTTAGSPHDAAVLSGHVPAGVLLVASRPHANRTPMEFSRIEDVTAAARVLFDTVKDRRLG